MRLEILNSFSGDDPHDFDTSKPEGRQEAAKIVGDLIRSGSAVFLEKVINGITHTFRVTAYDESTNKLTIRLDSGQVNDPDIEHAPRKRGPGRPKGIPRRSSYGRVSPETGRTVAVAPRSGG